MSCLSRGFSEKRDVQLLATPSCSFANLLMGNKLGSKLFRGLTGHAFEGLKLCDNIVGPLQATKAGFLKGVLHDHIFSHR